MQKRQKRLDQLVKTCSESLIIQGFSETQILHEKYLNLRYESTETSLMILEQNENWEFENGLQKRIRGNLDLLSVRNA
nr:BPK_HP1_G0042770.mRNA.1.CDS.1 [Saccharomyces cerevisiae]